MDNIEFSKQLEKRTRIFAVRIIRRSSTLPNTPEGMVVRNQMTKAGTSIGANYREANRARSRRDFKNKIKICESAASETQYWLEVVVDLKWETWEKVKADYDECSESLAIFTSIGKNT
ncbi:MAG TPA: four helix bundle protein [Deltaproteobacteria bacterium]|nr:four helix bundle protein [Deltaproteobacteria bacterium]